MYMVKHNQLVVVQYDLHPQVDHLKKLCVHMEQLKCMHMQIMDVHKDQIIHIGTVDPKELVGLCSKYTQKILNMVA